ARPLLGRVFTAADEAADAPLVILLSYDTWRRHFGGYSQIVGRTITFDPVLGPRVPTEYTVIGVMAESFQFPDSQTRVWTPTRLTPVGSRVPRGSMLARLADDASFAAAEAEILPLVRRIREGLRDNATANYELVGVQQELVRPVRPALIVVTLVLARTAARQREIVIRIALGAGRWRLMRYLLTESVTLGLCGGLAGVLLAFGGVRVLRWLAAALPRIDLGNQLSIPRINEIGVDGTVLAFSFVISIATGVLFGLVPALRYARGDDSMAMREGERSTVSGRRLRRHVSVRGALVV